MSTLPEVRTQTANRILNALTRAEYERLSRHLTYAAMPRGKVLYRADEPITHVYFPNRGTVSVVSLFEDGASVEVGMVGNEGMFGVCVFLGSISTPMDAVVQLPGDGLMMRADVLRGEFRKGGQLQDLLLRYTQVFITQVAQAAACNRAHDVNSRLAKWLLTCQDRSHYDDLELTHEFIGTMLGSRRAGITEAAIHLQEMGVIRYRRGHIEILDREALEASSCECYLLLKKEFARLIGETLHTHYETRVRVPASLLTR